MSRPSESVPDPQAFKSSQRELWSDVAAGWRAWWRIFEAGAQPLSDRMVALARVGPGGRVLDVATGIGEPAVTAARVVGATGRVLGTDLATEMVAIARERARELGLANAEFRELDAERLELPPASFDAALSRWGLMLMLDPNAALRGMQHALVPGGRVVAAVWGAKGTVPFMTIPGDVAQRELGIAPAPPELPGPLKLGRAGQLAELLRGAGFADVEEERVEVVLSFANPGEYVAFLQDLSATLRRTLDDAPPEARERVWRGVARESERWRTTEGRIVFRNEVRIAHGVKPR
ncbi:MAG: methyltransferase domain-containing protein [Planctomycetes bacterium]|nr:methyltransferase domain-containing protein [Planctomycetota bacterium]